MAKSDQTAATTRPNEPAAKRTTGSDASRPEARTVAPTPEAGSDPTTEKESVVDAAREAAAERAETAKQKAADATQAQADNMRDAGESFDPDSYARAATDRLAEGLNEAAHSIQNADFRALSDDVATFARRQPLLFFGGAALLGFAAGRMMKASERADLDYDRPPAPDYVRTW
jgi:hypothetical protein